jgi:hypothetical protein
MALLWPFNPSIFLTGKNRNFNTVGELLQQLPFSLHVSAISSKKRENNDGSNYNQDCKRGQARGGSTVNTCSVF